MKLKIEIKMDSAVFGERGAGSEVERILAHLATVIGCGNLGMVPGASMPLTDLNGKRVGIAKVVGKGDK